MHVRSYTSMLFRHKSVVKALFVLSSPFVQFIDGGSVDEKAEGVEKVLVAKGDNLEERKKMLMDNADALIVMPGAPYSILQLLNH